MTEPSRDDREPGITPGADLPVALDDHPLLSDTPRSRVAVALIWTAVLVAAVVLFKYAVDVLFVLLVLGCVAFLLNLLIKWLAESELLTPAWAIIIILIIATAGWFGWPILSSISPVDAIERGLHYERILPRQAVTFLEWAGQYGWAQRVLTPRDPSESRELALRGRAEVSIVVTCSQRTLRVGQPVTFTATLTFLGPLAAGISKTVEFYDGSASMGRVAFSLSDGTGVASITTTALTSGTHWITARYARTLLFSSVTSPPLTVTVIP